MILNSLEHIVFCILIDVVKVVVLASESWRKWSNTSSVWSPVVNEEWMRPGHWLKLMS